MLVFFPLFGGLSLASQTPKAEVWLAPQGLPQSPSSKVKNVDFMQMFQTNAPWTFTASQTKVFLLYGGAGLATAPQSQVDTIVADLNRRGITIALTGEQFINPHTCDATPGNGPKLAERISKKIIAAGGDVKYLAMDEPLCWGRYGGVQNRGWHMSISNIITAITPSINVYRRYFPKIQVGEEEPIGNVSWANNWRNDYSNWVSSFQAAFGQPLAFVQLDIPLANNYKRTGSQTNVDNAVAFYNEVQGLKEQNLIGKVGIIIDGSPIDTTDVAWVMNAQDHLLMWEDKYGFRPDQLIFQSWNINPIHALPETSPETLTSLVPFYINYLSGQLPPPVTSQVNGVVTAINGTTLTVTGDSNGNCYTVDASHAASNVPFSGMRAGDLLMIEGNFQGLNITASKIRDTR